MRKHLVFLILFFVLSHVTAQVKSINESGSSEYFIEILQDSKNLKYSEILETYNTYIEKNPEQIISQIERCKFIGNSSYDVYEDYNPNYDEMIDCIDNLINRYPENPEVLLYKLEYTWSDERKNLIADALISLEKNKDNWTYNHQSRLYEFAFNYHIEDNDDLAIMYAKRAERFSDSLDLSVEISEAYLRLGKTKKAKDALMNALFYDSKYGWVLKRKGDLLVDFEEIDEAVKMFERASIKDSTLTNNESLYKIFLERNKIDEARNYLVKDTIEEWEKAGKIQKLLNHDISYSSFDTSIISYRRMQDLSYNDDFFGVKRIRLFFKSPFQLWTWNEITHILLLVLAVFTLFVVPYLWILPVYSAKKFFRIKLNKKLIDVDWNLRHFWLISFVYLISQFILILCFYYQDFINAYLEVAYLYGVETFNEIEVISANSNLFFFFLMLCFTALFLNKRRIKFVFNTTFGLGKIILYAIGFVIVNAIVIRIVTNLFGAEDTIAVMQTLNSRAEIDNVLSQYGFSVAFFSVAVIVPLYEEIIFRGIILSSIEKHIGFLGANIIQASLFSLVHMSFQLFLYYFIFGLITGYMVKKSEGLFVGFVFHAVNNFLVLVSIAFLSSIQ
ncbi:CPBP family glutamic-type intramembrane protease [uncultured Winogradskyella sp.]|uniref:CPBP family glutamic-type intramembrane protease n=1 Tax=uncultured Winogradskyella sp. TaxID=395353 RepID=UPI0030DBF00C|tara:strand:- start:20584 stop:22431 length:1848 start_codon:yes stop_codon:yes gene_type:complete